METHSSRPRLRPEGSWPEQPAGREWEQPIPPPARRSGRHSGVAWEATLALLALAIVIAGIAAILITEIWLADRVLPGVYVWDIDLGGLTRAEAVERLAAGFSYPADRQLTLRYGQQTWPVDPAYLGTRLDVETAVETALTVGHRGDLLTQLQEQADVLLNGTLVMPFFSFEPGTGTMFLSQVTNQVNRSLRNASLTLGDDLSVTVIPGQVGYEVDEEATLQALVQRTAALTGGEVELVIRQSEPLLADLSAAQAEVERILSGPIRLTSPEGEVWIIEPKTLAGWLILRPVTDQDGNATLAIKLDSNLATRFAEDLAGQVARAPSDAQFRFDEVSGSLVPIVDSADGRTLDVAATVQLIESAATAEQRSIPLPLVPVRPGLATEDAASLGIVELVAEGKTSFAGSTASRVQNIVVGSAQFDGILIAPGETFSFNHYLGEVTAEQGYEESIIIWGNTTRADVGGGLCQVSSTAFRAAFWAGVPIDERWAHAFRVSYYEPPKGLDATIYSPSVDLKWTNDTGHHILIQTYVDKANSTLTFRLFGTKPNRTVEIDGPYEENPVAHGPAVHRDDPTLPKGTTKQIEWAKDGLDVTVHRIIKVDGVEAKRDTFFSRYRPWQAVYLVGTKEE